jgi:hypothetical protein
VVQVVCSERPVIRSIAKQGIAGLFSPFGSPQNGCVMHSTALYRRDPQNVIGAIWIWTISLLFCTGSSALSQTLRFQSIQKNGQGAINLRLEVIPGKTYFLERSSTLTSWTQVSAKTAIGSSLEFDEPVASSAGAQFYRVAETSSASLERIPASDQFASARQLSGNFAVGGGSNVGASSEPGEPDHSWFDPGKTSVWWKWVAPASGRVSVSLIGTHFETFLAVYTGSSLADLQVAAKSRQISKLLGFDAKAGVTYHIAVAGHFDATGEIKLALQLTPTPAVATVPAIAAASIFLDETSNPNIPLRVIDVGADGLSWEDRDNGTADPVEFGGVINFTSANPGAAALTLASRRPTETNTIAYAFAFDSNSTGSYAYTIDGVPSGNGRFANFRDTRAGLAPPSLSRTVIQAIRTRTSIGTSGQRHLYTFGWAGDFHDSDGQEHASGSYTYSSSGANGVLKLSYTGPAEIAGDDHEVRLKFATSTHGTYTGSYRRNDGTVIEIDGDFVLEFR